MARATKKRQAKKAPRPKLDKSNLNGNKVEPPKEVPKVHKGGKGKKPAGPMPATDEDYLAVLLNGERKICNDLRLKLLEKEQEIVNLRLENGRLIHKVTTQEIADSQRAMNALVKDRFGEERVNQMIIKDPKTGKVTWIEAPPASPEPNKG